MRALGDNPVARLCCVIAFAAGSARAAPLSAQEPRGWTPTRVSTANGPGWSSPRLSEATTRDVTPLTEQFRARRRAGKPVTSIRQVTGHSQPAPLRRTFFAPLTAPPADAGVPQPVVPPAEPPTYDSGEADTWQVLPPGMLFHSYLAGEKEPRMGTSLLFERGGDTLEESTLGARLGLVRYGTPGAIQPEGWQLDVEGAAFLRQNWTHDIDVDAVDFRVGVPLTWRRGAWAAKFGYYHLSSHAGDEFLVRTPGFQRINYVRDSVLAALAYNITPDWLIYGEAAYAFNVDGGAQPWEFQFGVEYSPVARNGFRGTPFFAVNGHLREEFNFGGSVNVEFGWQWRSAYSDTRLRIGGQFYNGKSMQYSFFNRNEQLIGVGIWYDF